MVADEHGHPHTNPLGDCLAGDLEAIDEIEQLQAADEVD